MAQASTGMINPASGRQMLAASQALSATALIFSPDPEIKAAAAVPILGPAILARLLTNPTATRWLVKGFQFSPTQAKASGWTARLLNFVRLAEREEDAEVSQKASAALGQYR